MLNLTQHILNKDFPYSQILLIDAFFSITEPKSMTQAMKIIIDIPRIPSKLGYAKAR